MIKVSALVSLYNSMEYVQGLMEDLTQQSLFKKGEMEIVVIDSNSPHNEKSIIERYQAQYSNIVYHRTTERETLYEAWNTGISKAKGEFLTNANSDDRHHPEGLEILLLALEGNPQIDLVYADVFESNIANEPFYANRGQLRYRYPIYFAPEALLAYQFGCQPMWRRSVNEKIGGFNGKLRAAGDWDFCIRFALAGLKAMHVNRVLGSFLNRPTSLSTQDQTSTKEQNDLRNVHITPENIKALYAIEGWDVSSAKGIAEAFTDFAKRASAFKLPWLPNESFLDAYSVIMAAHEAFNLSQGNARAIWNLGVALYISANTEKGAELMTTALKSTDPVIASAATTLTSGQFKVAPFVGLA
jgi:glycosyltransferase involved in cell wall biosynthesis